MADAEEDFSSLPLPDRFVHKVWKVRKQGYEDAAKQFALSGDENDPMFRPFLNDASLWKGAVADSNVAAQQDGIAALCEFLKFGGREHCTRTRNQTITPLAEKGLSSTRAATKASALEAILLYVELDVGGPVIEELLPVLANKQPKVIAATLAALTTIFHNYGCKTVDPKPVLKVLPKAFGHADKNVRAEATNLAAELYRWLRDAIKPLLWSELKPTQQTDLEAQFEKLKAEPTPKQERLLRTQQEALARAPPPGDDDAAAEEEESEEPVEIDSFELMEAKDVLSKVPANFHELLASTKWKDRKDAVDALYAVVNVPKIKDGDFNEVVRGLAKCMKDANVAVVAQAAQCIEVLARGLRKSFAKYRPVVSNPILERLKEKKAVVSEALGGALDQVFAATGLSELLEEIVEFLKHKNPAVKEGTVKFLIRCLKTTRDVPAKPEVTTIVEAAKKLFAESSEVLRSGGAEVFGTLMKIMGERPMAAHLDGLDEVRKTKIKEYFDVAEVKAKDKPKPPPAAPKAAPAAAPKKMVAKKPAAKKPAPVASAYAQEAPLAPQPTARSVPSKLGAAKGLGVGGLKAPQKRTLGGPGGAAPPALASPRRPAARAPTPEEDDIPAPPRPGLGRGLAGRTLSKTPTLSQAPPPLSPPPSSGLSSAERAELEELRLDKDRLLRQADDMRQERSRLNSEVQELKNQNAQLIEDHTRDVLSIKAKETQLVRARSDCEAAEAMCGQLRREMERLKRALTSAERINAPSMSPSRESMTDDGIYRDSGHYGVPPSRTKLSYTSSVGEEKENGDQLAAQYGRSKLTSPDFGPPSGRMSAASGSTGRNSPAPAYTSRFSSRDQTTEPSKSDTNGQGVESWKRAAEVTSALKAKIELMKARQGLNRP